MRTRNQIMMLKALDAVLIYMGNDPRVFSLYFTCKFLYKNYIMKRQRVEYEGYEKFINYGHEWEISLKDFEKSTMIRF